MKHQTDISKLLPKVCEKCGRKLRGDEVCRDHEFKPASEFEGVPSIFDKLVVLKTG
jgi:predicted amidophosphoribosyltransferase